jgi:hypothetical protein
MSPVTNYIEVREVLEMKHSDGQTNMTFTVHAYVRW